MNIRNYASFLAALLALGPKLQALWPKITALFAAAQDIEQAIEGMLPARPTPEPAPSPAAPPADGTLAMVAETNEDEIAALELRVAELVAGPNAAFDPSTFKTIWIFLSKHPEWINALGYIFSVLTHAA